MKVKKFPFPYKKSIDKNGAYDHYKITCLFSILFSKLESRTNHITKRNKQHNGLIRTRSRYTSKMSQAKTMRASESQLVASLLLIGQESGASLTNHSHC